MKRVYFLRRTSGEGPIKIGSSTRPYVRCTDVARGMGESLEVILHLPGTMADEMKLHRMFADLREPCPLCLPNSAPVAEGRAEWFRAEPKLLKFIEASRKRRKIVFPKTPHFDADVRAKGMDRLRRKGYTLQQIADEYDLSRQRVHQILKAGGYETRDGTTTKEQRWQAEQSAERRKRAENERLAAFMAEKQRERAERQRQEAEALLD